MDNTAPFAQGKQSQNQDQVPMQSPVAPPVPQTSIPQVVPASGPISVPQKEMAPVGLTESILAPKVEPFLQPSSIETRPEIAPELAEHGVEAVVHKETPQLTVEHKNVGIEPAKESVPVVTSPSGVVTLPLTEEEAQHVVKTHKRVSDSVLWLATLILKHAKLMHGKITGGN